MAKRIFDLVVSALLLVAASPLMLVAAIGIRLCSPGPIIFRAARVGLDGELFEMHKFRTMHAEQQPQASVITRPRDARVFRFGSILRGTKIDELPQLLDVIRGKMSWVGPRPEDPKIVEQHFTREYRETLAVRPGLTSPGNLYNYTHEELLLADDDPELAYATRVLPIKMALERVYVGRASFAYDLRILARTVSVLTAIALGQRRFADPPEMAIAERKGWLRPAAATPTEIRAGPRRPA
jgi:lipopolysaccharide/colanic/teichoic acid biosynthesis glycosyltransferase